LISADSEWPDVYTYAQALLDAHAEARGLIDEARRRRHAAKPVVGDLSTREWSAVERWRSSGAVLRSEHLPRPVRDYAAAVRAAAMQLGLTKSRAHVVHELVGRSGYQLTRPEGVIAPRGPAGPVASAFAADVTGKGDWRSGPAANRQTRYRYLGVAAVPDKPFTVMVSPDMIV
jgi:hypothetical protein